MKTVVLDAGTLGNDLDFSVLGAFGELVIYEHTYPEEMEAHLAGAEAAVINKVRMDESALSRGKDLKLLCIAATGYDPIDTAYCKAHGIAVCNVRGYSTDSVAQVTMALVLALSVNLPVFTGLVRDGSYTKGGVANILSPAFHELHGKTWGIAGWGNIGQAVGRAAAALGAKVIYYKKTPVEDPACVSLDTLLKASDILSIHLPLNEDTRNLFSREKLALMKPSAILVNTGRGAVTDEEAIAERILSGALGAFGADVYSEEPFPESHPFQRLSGLPNVLLTPHMAWGALEARERCMAEISENMKSFLNGGGRNRIV